MTQKFFKISLESFLSRFFSHHIRAQIGNGRTVSGGDPKTNKYNTAFFVQLDLEIISCMGLDPYPSRGPSIVLSKTGLF